MMTIIEPERGELTRNDEIRKELSAIAAGKAGLTPQSLLAAAKSPRSTLHRYFTWDDSEAAAKWREAQAYELIRRVRVTIETQDHKQITVRAFWPVKQVADDGTINMGNRGSYLPLHDVAGDTAAMEQILAVAKSELRAFRTKYSQLERIAEMTDLFEAINEVLE
jgi:hypothetical protein